MISSAGRPRIAMYSHDTMGLGHMRRNFLLGKTLAGSHLEPNILLLSGAIDAKSFYMPTGVDCVTLPSLYKEHSGTYSSRRLRMSLDELISIRRRILRSSVAAFDPHLLIVDAAPLGVSGELDATLRQLKAERLTTCVLGMRDVWDEPGAVALEWAKKKNWGAVRTYYDQVWVYGDPTVYDTVREYRLEEDIAAKVRYTGYLGRSADSIAPTVDYAEMPESYGRPFSLCVMGGGQDGMLVAEAFLKADFPRGLAGLLITGPYMSPKDMKRLRGLAAARRSLRVIDFVPEPLSFIRKAESVVSMGGYNAVCEIVSFGKRALIVPRVWPRKEQLIRAERMRALGLIEMAHPHDLGPDVITEFLRRGRVAPQPSAPIDMGGLAKVSALAESLLAGTGFGAEATTVGGNRERGI